MAYVSSQLIEGVTAHAQSDSLEGEGEIWADSTYFPNNLRNTYVILVPKCTFSGAVPTRPTDSRVMSFCASAFLEANV